MIDVEGIKNLIGRPLTEREHRHITWINGWDSESRESFARLIKDAYWNGAKEATETVKDTSANEMSTQEINEFAKALAVRYKQTMSDNDKAREEYSAADSANLDQKSFHQIYMRRERTLSQYKLFVETIDILPVKIQLPFYEHLKSIE
ncbi:hypothetical protein [Fontibacillus sp. BL9]|uniref:hypothetical protein n=1 Tax=Fontibacillus sp. BL9 TaxID=3389971 RepID=UPI00397BD960